MMKIQNCLLKVNIHCEGCEQKVKKLLQKIEGVYSVNIDAEQGKVLVTGDVDPAKLLKKLKSSGKHAELWGGQKAMMINQNQNFQQQQPQFKNMQIDNNKGGKNNKPQNQKGQKGGVQVAQFQNPKGGKDMKVPNKSQKHVNFDLSEEEFDESDGGFDDYDDEDDFDEDEEEEFGHGHGHGQGPQGNGFGQHPMHNNKMMMAMMQNQNGRGPQLGPGGGMMMNGPAAKIGRAHV